MNGFAIKHWRRAKVMLNEIKEYEGYTGNIENSRLMPEIWVKNKKGGLYRALVIIARKRLEDRGYFNEKDNANQRKILGDVKDDLRMWCGIPSTYYEKLEKEIDNRLHSRITTDNANSDESISEMDDYSEIRDLIRGEIEEERKQKYEVEKKDLKLLKKEYKKTRKEELEEKFVSEEEANKKAILEKDISKQIENEWKKIERDYWREKKQKEADEVQELEDGWKDRYIKKCEKGNILPMDDSWLKRYHLWLEKREFEKMSIFSIIDEIVCVRLRARDFWSTSSSEKEERIEILKKVYFDIYMWINYPNGQKDDEYDVSKWEGNDFYFEIEKDGGEYELKKGAERVREQLLKSVFSKEEDSGRKAEWEKHWEKNISYACDFCQFVLDIINDVSNKSSTVDEIKKLIISSATNEEERVEKENELIKIDNLSINLCSTKKEEIDLRKTAPFAVYCVDDLPAIVSSEKNNFKEYIKAIILRRIKELLNLEEEPTITLHRLNSWEHFVSECDLNTTIFQELLEYGNMNLSVFLRLHNRVTYERVLADAVHLGKLKTYYLSCNEEVEKMWLNDKKYVIQKGTGNGGKNIKSISNTSKGKEEIDNIVKLIAYYLIEKKNLPSDKHHEFVIISGTDLANWTQNAEIYKDPRKYLNKYYINGKSILEIDLREEKNNNPRFASVMKVRINPDLIENYQFNVSEDVTDNYYFVDDGHGIALKQEKALLTPMLE